MSWNDIADRTLKTVINAFKTPAVYTRAGNPGSPISIMGVFNVPNREVDPQTGASVQSTAPTFGIRLADLPAPPDAGDQIEVNTVLYNVFNVDEDGQGGAELALAKAT